MYTHDGVMALFADETGFRPFEGSQVLMVLHAWRELDGLADRRTVQETVEVDPFAAIAGPRLATKGNPQASRKHPLFKFAQVFTDQLWFLTPLTIPSGIDRFSRFSDVFQIAPAVWLRTV
jgi:hypothetical protein